MSHDKDGSQERESRIPGFLRLFVKELPPDARTGDAVPAADDAPEAPLPPGTASPEAVAKLKADIGADGTTAFAQFMSIVESLADSIPDEAARFKAAMKVAKKTRAVEIKDLLAEFAAQRSTLEAKVKEFRTRLAKVTDETVGGKKQELTTLEAQVTTQRELLAGLEQQASELRTAISADEAKLTGAAANFMAARDAVQSEIDANETKFKALLGS